MVSIHAMMTHHLSRLSLALHSDCNWLFNARPNVVAEENFPHTTFCGYLPPQIQKVVCFRIHVYLLRQLPQRCANVRLLRNP